MIFMGREDAPNALRLNMISDSGKAVAGAGQTEDTYRTHGLEKAQMGGKGAC